MPSSITVPTLGGGQTLTGYFTLATDSTFIGKVAIAAGLVAAKVLAEDPTYYTALPAGIDNARKKYASLVNSNPQAYATQSIAFYILAYQTITSGSSDNDIVAAVAAIWTDLSFPYSGSP